MSSGIIIPSIISIASSASESLIFGGGTNFQQQLGLAGPWTPPQYSKSALTVLTVPGTTSTTTGETSTTSINYVFDAVFRILHKRTSHKTSHPVLTGANITDHIYAEPSRVSLEIGMSDAMSSFDNSIWVGASTKSISAWQILKSLQRNKTLVTLTTRLDTYSNMFIVESTAPDDNKTNHALKATIVFEELIAAYVISAVATSSRPQTSNSTSNGVVQSNSPTTSQTNQFEIPSPLYPSVQTYPQILGAGNISSNNLSKLQR